MLVKIKAQCAACMCGPVVVEVDNRSQATDIILCLHAVLAKLVYVCGVTIGTGGVEREMGFVASESHHQVAIDHLLNLGHQAKVGLQGWVEIVSF